MCDDHAHQQENTPDPLYVITVDVHEGLTHSSLSAEFLAQLLADIPDVLPTLITTHTSPSPSLSPSVTVTATTPVSKPYLACQWVSPDESPSICGAPLSQDPKLACDHFRYAHDVRGNEKVHVDCHWRDCRVPPMLRGSVVRHVLTVHLGLLRWRCEVCGKVFSRRGTGHACVE
ncbi:hypothetical protein J3R82DRAFT_4929, partial [Butyriboletus roseoflavus]